MQANTYPLVIGTAEGLPIRRPGGEADPFEFRIEHDGQIGSLQRGAVVLIEPAASIRGDGVYLVRLSGCPMFRRVQVLPRWRYRLSCDDEAYPPVEVDGADGGGFEVLGRFLEVVTFGPHITRRRMLVS